MDMLKPWMALPLALVLAACPGDRTQDDLTDFDPITPGEEQGMPPGPGVTPEPAAMSETAQFQELQGSGVTGQVSVMDRGAQTEVTVNLTGAPPNSSLPGHIHSGTCDAIGGVVQALEPIATDAAGAGTMTTTVSVAPMTVMSGQHIVVYHAAGAPTTCAAIPAHAM